MTIITLNNISKSIAGNLILENITAKIEPSQKIGIIGRNGEGKTTLLQILGQKEPISSGEIFWQKNIKIGFSDQIIQNDLDSTAYAFLKEAFSDLAQLEKRLQVAEKRLYDNPTEKELAQYGNLQEEFMLAGGYDIDNNINKVTSGLNIADLLEHNLQSLSGGQKTRLMLSRALLRNPDILLLDEPTNHLDLQAISWLSSYLKSYQGTVIIVSHDRYLLDDVCSQIWEIEDKQLMIYHANFTQYQTQKEELLIKEFAAFNNQQKQIQKLEQAIKQMREWAKRADNPAMFKRAKNKERILERMVRVKKPNINPKTMELKIVSSNRSGKEVFKLMNAYKFFDEKVILFDTSLQINFGERIAIMGPNGAGKTTFLKILMEMIALDDGKIVQGSNLQLAYLSQELEELNPNHTIIDAFRDKVMVSEYDARHMLATFLFYGYDVFKKIKDLSGGELMRLRLAWFMEAKVNTIILDEPTNHLDIASREVLENVLSKFKGTIIIVSHDRYFIDVVCEKILWLENGIIETYLGGYEEVKEKHTRS